MTDNVIAEGTRTVHVDIDGRRIPCISHADTITCDWDASRPTETP